MLVYDLKCPGSEAYLRLATEVIQREKGFQGAARERERAALTLGLDLNKQTVIYNKQESQ